MVTFSPPGFMAAVEAGLPQYAAPGHFHWKAPLKQRFLYQASIWQRLLYLAAVPIAFLRETLAAPRATEACPVLFLPMPVPAQYALHRQMASCVSISARDVVAGRPARCQGRPFRCMQLILPCRRGA